MRAGLRRAWHGALAAAVVALLHAPPTASAAGLEMPRALLVAGCGGRQGVLPGHPGPNGCGEAGCDEQRECDQLERDPQPHGRYEQREESVGDHALADRPHEPGVASRS